MPALFTRILLLNLLLSGSLFAAEAVPASKVIKDWVVACNNLRQCEATSLRLPPFDDADGQEYSAVLGFRRHASAAERAEFFIIAGAFMTETPAALRGQTVTLSADRTTLDAGIYTTNDRGEFILPAALTDRLITMVRKPATLTLTIGNQSFNASLRGITAAMLYVDEKQQRLETPTALVKRGQQVMAATPPAPAPLKKVTAPAAMTVPADLIAQVRAAQGEIMRKSECVEESPVNLDFAHPLDTQNYLVSLGCWLAAYNTQSLLFRVSTAGTTAKPKMVLLRLPGHKDNSVSGANFDPQTGVLSSYYKGRGLGDCGGYSEYIWDSKRFVMIRADEMPVCRGTSHFLNVWQLPVE